MRLTITDSIKIDSIEVEPNQLVEDVKAVIEVQFGIPIDRQILYYQSKELKNNQRLNEAGVRQDALLFVQLGMAMPSTKPAQPVGGKFSIKDMIKNVAQQQKQGIIPQAHVAMGNELLNAYKKQAERLKKEIREDPERFAHALEKDAELASAVMNDDLTVLAQLLIKKDEESKKKKLEEQKKFLELSKDPFNPEYQKLLEQKINQQNIEQNLEHAQEFTPEVFGTVCMLYINATINKVPIQAFVDSGAQMTVMSIECAERCGVLRLVDKRYEGMAVGVGSSKIIGRVHAAEIMIEGKFITCSLTVIENNDCQFLLGLDMLKRFNCVMDLKKGELNFQDGMILTRFLPEGEIKKKKKALPPAASKPNIDQTKITLLESMGFGRQESIDALRQTGGNEQAAAAILSQKRFGN